MRFPKTTALIGMLACAAPAMAQEAPAPVPRTSYDQVVAQLKSAAPENRLDALRSLGATAYPEAIAQISQLLTDPA